MKLYEINAEIQRLADMIDFDPETGEVLTDTEEIDRQIMALQMERESILGYLAKLVINLRSEASALKDEETRLKDRRMRLELREKRLMKILDRECGGVKTDLGIATVSYRAATRLEVLDAAKAVRWLKRHKHAECIRVKEPEVAKTETRRLMETGAKVPGCSVVKERSCSLR